MLTQPNHVVRGERGALLVETAFSMGLFFLLILAGIDMMRLGYNVMCTQYVVSAQIRQAILGTSAAGPNQDGPTRGHEIQNNIIDGARVFGIDLGSTAGDNKNVTVCAVNVNCTCVPSPSDPCTDNAGNDNDLISVRVSFPLKLIFGLASYNVTAYAVGRNEPFSAL